MNIKNYEAPKAEVILFSENDIVTTSDGFSGEEDEVVDGGGSGGGSFEGPVLPKSMSYYNSLPTF